MTATQQLPLLLDNDGRIVADDVRPDVRPKYDLNIASGIIVCVMLSLVVWSIIAVLLIGPI